MCAYNGVNGDYSCENVDLLAKALRDLWSFAGFVVSDWGAAYETQLHRCCLPPYSATRSVSCEVGNSRAIHRRP
jgi:hypothetical protein